jgi:hypothetical protein
LVAFAGLRALPVLVAFVAFVSLAARGMVIFPYGVGNSTILSVPRRGLPGGPIPRAEKLPDNR